MVELSLINVWNTIQLGDAQARTVVVFIYGEDAIRFHFTTAQRAVARRAVDKQLGQQQRMSFGQAYLLVLAILIAGQIMMTRLYGWRGLAFTTAAEIIAVFSGGVLSMALLKARYGGGDTFGVYTIVFIAAPVLLLLVTALILAAFVKTE